MTAKNDLEATIRYYTDDLKRCFDTLAEFSISRRNADDAPQIGAYYYVIDVIESLTPDTVESIREYVSESTMDSASRRALVTACAKLSAIPGRCQRLARGCVRSGISIDGAIGDATKRAILCVRAQLKLVCAYIQRCCAGLADDPAAWEAINELYVQLEQMRTEAIAMLFEAGVNHEEKLVRRRLGTMLFDISRINMDAAAVLHEGLTPAARASVC